MANPIQPIKPSNFKVALVDGDALGKTWVDACGYVRHGRDLYLHRTVMERHLGRKLEAKEHVHHKDHNKQNNDIDNLVVCSAQEHLRMHAYERIEELGGIVGKDLYCTYHKCLHPIDAFSTNPRYWSGRHHCCRDGTNEYRRLNGYTRRARRQAQRWKDNLSQQYRRIKSGYTKGLVSWL